MCGLGLFLEKKIGSKNLGLIKKSCVVIPSLKI